jgi:transcriptional regulator with XRE-family HTH domain
MATSLDRLEMRMARLRRGLRQRDVAVSLGIAPQRVSDFEQGLRDPSEEQATLLGKLLGLDILIDSARSSSDRPASPVRRARHSSEAQ